MKSPAAPRVDDRLLHEARLFPIDPPPGSSFSFRHILTRTFPFPFHYHPELEITYVARGHGRRIVGEVVRPFQDGDIVLLGSMLPHVWISDAHCTCIEAYILRFDGGLLDRHLSLFAECSAALTWLRRAPLGLEFRSKITPALADQFQTIRQAPTAPKRLSAFLDLLPTLAATGRWRAICGGLQGPLVRGGTEQRIGFALRYLREHFCEEVAQADVAHRVGMSPAAFSRLFQRVTGQTFQQMLVHLRVEHACRLLSATTMSVADICFASGFRNLSNFNKQFLACKNLSPRAFRQQALPL